MDDHRAIPRSHSSRSDGIVEIDTRDAGLLSVSGSLPVRARSDPMPGAPVMPSGLVGPAEAMMMARAARARVMMANMDAQVAPVDGSDDDGDEQADHDGDPGEGLLELLKELKGSRPVLASYLEFALRSRDEVHLMTDALGRQISQLMQEVGMFGGGQQLHMELSDIARTMGVNFNAVQETSEALFVAALAEIQACLGPPYLLVPDHGQADVEVQALIKQHLDAMKRAFDGTNDMRKWILRLGGQDMMLQRVQQKLGELFTHWIRYKEVPRGKTLSDLNEDQRVVWLVHTTINEVDQDVGMNPEPFLLLSVHSEWSELLCVGIAQDVAYHLRETVNSLRTRKDRESVPRIDPEVQDSAQQRGNIADPSDLGGRRSDGDVAAPPPRVSTEAARMETIIVPGLKRWDAMARAAGFGCAWSFDWRERWLQRERIGGFNDDVRRTFLQEGREALKAVQQKYEEEHMESPFDHGAPAGPEYDIIDMGFAHGIDPNAPNLTDDDKARLRAQHRRQTVLAKWATRILSGNSDKHMLLWRLTGFCMTLISAATRLTLSDFAAAPEIGSAATAAALHCAREGGSKWAVLLPDALEEVISAAHDENSSTKAGMRLMVESRDEARVRSLAGACAEHPVLSDAVELIHASLDCNAHAAAPADPNAPAAAPVDPNAPAAAPVDPNAPAAAPVDPNAHAAAPVDPNAPAAAPADPNAPAAAPIGPNAPAAAPIDPNAPAAAPVGPNAPAAAPVDPNAPAAAHVDPNAHAPAAPQQRSVWGDLLELHLRGGDHDFTVLMEEFRPDLGENTEPEWMPISEEAHSNWLKLLEAHEEAVTEVGLTMPSQGPTTMSTVGWRLWHAAFYERALPIPPFMLKGAAQTLCLSSVSVTSMRVMFAQRAEFVPFMLHSTQDPDGLVAWMLDRVDLVPTASSFGSLSGRGRTKLVTLLETMALRLRAYGAVGTMVTAAEGLWRDLSNRGLLRAQPYVAARWGMTWAKTLADTLHNPTTSTTYMQVADARQWPHPDDVQQTSASLWREMIMSLFVYLCGELRAADPVQHMAGDRAGRGSNLRVSDSTSEAAHSPGNDGDERPTPLGVTHPIARLMASAEAAGCGLREWMRQYSFDASHKGHIVNEATLEFLVLNPPCMIDYCMFIQEHGGLHVVRADRAQPYSWDIEFATSLHFPTRALRALMGIATHSEGDLIVPKSDKPKTLLETSISQWWVSLENLARFGIVDAFMDAGSFHDELEDVTNAAEACSAAAQRGRERQPHVAAIVEDWMAVHKVDAETWSTSPTLQWVLAMFFSFLLPVPVLVLAILLADAEGLLDSDIVLGFYGVVTIVGLVVLLYQACQNRVQAARLLKRRQEERHWPQPVKTYHQRFE